MALEIEIHTLPEPVGSHQRMNHAAEFGALLVDGHRIEVVDLDEPVRPNRMRQGSGILGKLTGLEISHFGDALHGRRPEIRRIKLIPKNSQPFLEAELKPIAARNAIAGPIVEILVCDHPIDIEISGIRRRFRAGEHEPVVENIEAFVLHSPHIEIGDGHDIENVQIIFAAEPFLVPLHGALQALHGPAATAFLAGLDVDRQVHLAARHCLEIRSHGAEVACNKREQIGRLGMRIAPDHVVPPPAVERTALGEIAVRQQHGRRRHIGLDPRRLGRQNIRPVEEISDPAKALRLALRAINTSRHIKAR